jgi:hypothetical protein
VYPDCRQQYIPVEYNANIIVFRLETMLETLMPVILAFKAYKMGGLKESTVM